MLISVGWVPPYWCPSRRLLRSRREDAGLVTRSKAAPQTGAAATPPRAVPARARRFPVACFGVGAWRRVPPRRVLRGGEADVPRRLGWRMDALEAPPRGEERAGPRGVGAARARAAFPAGAQPPR